MIKKNLTIVLLFCCIRCLVAQSISYPYIEYLGKSLSDINYTELQKNYGINFSLINPQKGVKFYTDFNRERIESILFSNESLEINRINFSRFQDTLAFSLSFDMSRRELAEILGSPLSESINAISFQKEGYKIDAMYTDKTRPDKITYYSFSILNTNEISVNEELPFNPHYSSKIDEQSQFKQSSKGIAKTIEAIFQAAEDPLFVSIADIPITRKNIWNYRYLNKTSIKVDGELYNFLYSYPFATSQRDFVSIIADGSNVTSDLLTRYYNFRTKLEQSLTADLGWSVSYEINDYSPSLPRDVALTNPKFGTVILDYVKSPKGEEVVYLRFLFQYK